jgi:GT2 family glycosyltransferase
MPEPKVAAVIPHWNRRAMLESLLTNLKEQTRLFDRIIVADNGSTDGSPEAAERMGAQVIRLGENRGFAAAVNRGVQAAADADWIAILNNDVTLAPQWLATLLAAVERNQTSFATGKILRASDSDLIDATFDEVSRAACAWRCGSGRRDAPVWNQPQKIRMAPMTAAIFRRSLFDEIGPLDEAFVSYMEDVDFGLRCAFAGRSGVYAPMAEARHIGSATSGEWNKDTVRRIARNQVLLAKKHFRGSAVWPILVGQLLWGFVACRHGRAFSYLRGKLQGLTTSPAKTRQAVAWPTVKAVVEESEQRIFELQRATSFDSYWRAYFWLSRL